MSWLKELMRRADYLGRRSQFDRELDEEIRFHIETRVDELQREGMPPMEALHKAQREFGSRARISEDTRGAWRFQGIEDLWRDLSPGARAFAKSPGFTAVAVLSLGIGVGANCVMFSIVDATLLRPPRVPRPNEVVALVSTVLESPIPISPRFAIAAKVLRAWPRSPTSLPALPRGPALCRW
jgi:hypothetical protein